MSTALVALSTWEPQRPRVRGECLPYRTHPETGEVLPCPWASCRYSLLVDVAPGKSRLDDRSEQDLPETCALDVADRGGSTLEEVGQAFGVSRERIRQIEAHATRRMSRTLARDASYVELRQSLDRMRASGPLRVVVEDDGDDGDDDEGEEGTSSDTDQAPVPEAPKSGVQTTGQPSTAQRDREDRILALLARSSPLNLGQIQDELGAHMSRNRIQQALGLLRAEGRIRMRGHRSAVVYTLATEGTR